jgi:predicted dehydrogenase
METKAVVIGAGWAGEGHTLALREAGVDVIALCGRNPDAAREMAEKLDISDVRLDWREAIESLQPDVVSLATPAKPHREIAETASNLGSNLFCDKPIALSSAEAASMLRNRD